MRNRHDDPLIPHDVQPSDLDRVARAQLKTLSKENADEVARHLVMVTRLIEDDPETAHEHAVSAGRRAGRIAVVRETLAITAYSIGDYALALRELRTYRRISGRDDQLPLMVDSERGLDRADKALELGRSVPRESLPVDVQVQLAIAMSGARLDLGQTDAALLELEIAQLDPSKAFSYSPDLFAAYAAVLEDLGRTEDAELWFRRADVALDAIESASGDHEFEEIEVVSEDIVSDEASDSAADAAADPVPEPASDAAHDDAAHDDAAHDDAAHGDATPEPEPLEPEPLEPAPQGPESTTPEETSNEPMALRETHVEAKGGRRRPTSDSDDDVDD